jgi:hypothetical protein
VFRYARAGRSADVGRELERGDRSRSKREGAFGNVVITAEVRDDLVTTHYR